MNSILFLGMDLSGKSQNSTALSKSLNIPLKSNLLSIKKSLYHEYVNKMKNMTLSDKEKLELFYEIYKNDLEQFNISEKFESHLYCQDNLGIIRNIAYFYYLGYDANHLIEIFKQYPHAKQVFYLTFSPEERMKRLNQRNKDKKDDIYEKLLRENPNMFFELDKLSLELYKNFFDCHILDNTDMTQPETLSCVLSKVNNL